MVALKVERDTSNGAKVVECRDVETFGVEMLLNKIDVVNCDTCVGGCVVIALPFSSSTTL